MPRSISARRSSSSRAKLLGDWCRVSADKFYDLDTQPHPQPLDIVWCNFPERENPKRPGPKSRPALVRRWIESDQGLIYVEVAYGTTRENPLSAPYDLHIQNSGEIDKCGLLRHTCFILDRMAMLPWAPEYFCVRKDDGAGPIVGRLTEDRIERLKFLMKVRASA